MAQKKEVNENAEESEADLKDLQPPEDPKGGAKPKTFNPQPDPPGSH